MIDRLEQRLRSVTSRKPSSWLKPKRSSRYDVDLSCAAVLIPIVITGEGPTLVLTLRPQHMRTHAGQIAFPGGQADPGDATPEITALREAEEEIGLRHDQVRILGRMKRYDTGSGYAVHPVVGLIDRSEELVPQTEEVAEIIRIPMDYAFNPSNQIRKSARYRGRLRYYYEIPYNDHYIWGMTAAMIVNLSRINA